MKKQIINVSLPLLGLMAIAFSFSPGPKPFGILIFFPFFYLIFGFIFTVIGTWLYNIAATWDGGIECTSIAVEHE